MLNEYIIDVYQIFNPYTPSYNHLERIRFGDIRLMLMHLKYIEGKYENIPGVVVLTCKGDESAARTFDSCLKQFARYPEKHEIN